MKRVRSQPMRISQCNAMSIPDPTAGPLTIAMVGLRISEMSRWRSVNPWKKCWRAASGPSWAPRLPGKFSPVTSGDAPKVCSGTKSPADAGQHDHPDVGIVIAGAHVFANLRHRAVFLGGADQGVHPLRAIEFDPKD